MPLIRAEYTKKGRVRFISHLDLIRTMQRAVRRADIPIEYTKGFNPHSKISFGPALALGTGSNSEYMDLVLTDSIPERDFIKKMNENLPEGLCILNARYIPGDSPSLTSVINGAVYSIEADYRPQGGEWEQKILDFFSLEHCYIEKTNKKGRVRTVDIMPLVLEVKQIEVSAGKLYTELAVSIGSSRNLNPSDLAAALEKNTGIRLSNIEFERKKMLVIKNGSYFTPFQAVK